MKFQLSQLLGSLTSDDVFISYSRRDASTYAPGLADKLIERGLSPFLDKFGTDPNKELPDMLKQKIRSCKMLVLVGTERAAASKFVADEITEFLKAGHTNIVPVNFGESFETAIWKDDVLGIASEQELNEDALVSGNPSPAVVNRIVKQFNYTRSKHRLRRAIALATATLLLLLAVSGVAAYVAAGKVKEATEASGRATKALTQAAEAERKAETLTAETNRLADEERKQRGRAEEEAKRANDEALRAQQADASRATAEGKTRQAEQQRQTAEAGARVAEGKRQVAEAEASKQQEIAQIRALANQSGVTLKQGPALLGQSISFAAEALQRAETLKVHSVEADTALRESLALLPRTFKPRTLPVKDSKVAFSPDMKRYAVIGATGHTIRLFDSDDKEIAVSIVGGTESNMGTVALSNVQTIAPGKETQRIATANAHEIHVQSVGGDKSWDMEVSNAGIESMALSPNGKFLALILDPDDAEDQIKDAELWDVEKKKRISHLTGTGGLRLYSLAFSPNGETLAVGGGGPTARGSTGYVLTWDFRQLNEHVKASAGETAPTDETAPADKSRAVEADDTLRGLVDESPTKLSFDEEVTAIALSSDGHYFATANDRTVTIWKTIDVGVYERVGNLLLEGVIESLVFSSDGRTLAVIREGAPLLEEADASNAVGFGSTQHEQILEVLESRGYTTSAKMPYTEEISSLSFNPDGESVSAFTDGGNLKVWRAADGQEQTDAATVFNTSDHQMTTDVVVGHFVVAHNEENFFVLDTLKHKQFTIPSAPETRETRTACITPDGQTLVTIGRARSDVSKIIAAVYSFHADGYVRKQMLLPQGSPSEIKITGDGKQVIFLDAISGRDVQTIGGLQIMDVANGSDVTPASLKNLQDIASIELSPRGSYLATVRRKEEESDCTLEVWDARDGRPLASLKHGGAITQYAFSADERRVATAGEDGTAQVLDITTNSTIHIKHFGPVTNVAFATNAGLLATVSRRGNNNSSAFGPGSVTLTGASTLRVFDYKTGVEVVSLRHDQIITGISFSEDGRYLAAASKANDTDFSFDDETYRLQVWLVRPLDLIAEACGRLSVVSQTDEMKGLCFRR